jgi:bacteriocin biosynthesis cyclodehydratase domain-containing protein
MEIRFDTRLPLVWRDPQTLQIGADRPLVVLERLSVRDERIVAAIAGGHGRSGSAALAGRARCTEKEVASLLVRLRPALAPSPKRAVETIAIAGSCGLADEIAHLLEKGGHAITLVDAETVESCPSPPLGIAVSHHVHDPVVGAAWLRRDVPHLSVVVGDQRTRVGPLIVPGVTACAHCLDLHRSDVDRSWGVIAAQLWARAPIEPPLLTTREAAARAVRRVQARLNGATVLEVDEAIETVDSETGRVRRTLSRPHPACGCAALPRNDSGDAPLPRGLSPGSAPDGSTTAGAAGELA